MSLEFVERCPTAIVQSISQSLSDSFLHQPILYIGKRQESIEGRPQLVLFSGSIEAPHSVYSITYYRNGCGSIADSTPKGFKGQDNQDN
jgi:hypothetical protein